MIKLGDKQSEEMLVLFIPSPFQNTRDQYMSTKQ